MYWIVKFVLIQIIDWCSRSNKLNRLIANREVTNLKIDHKAIIVRYSFIVFDWRWRGESSRSSIHCNRESNRQKIRVNSIVDCNKWWNGFFFKTFFKRKSPLMIQLLTEYINISIISYNQFHTQVRKIIYCVSKYYSIWTHRCVNIWSFRLKRSFICEYNECCDNIHSHLPGIIFYLYTNCLWVRFWPVSWSF